MNKNLTLDTRVKLGSESDKRVSLLIEATHTENTLNGADTVIEIGWQGLKIEYVTVTLEQIAELHDQLGVLLSELPKPLNPPF